MTGRPRRLAAVAVALLLGTAGCAGLPGAAVDDAAPAPSVSAGGPTASSPADDATSATPSTAPSTSSTPTPSASPTRTPSPDAEPAAMLSKGDSGTKVRELQHRLRQLDWFAGDITGRYAASTVDAVEGFQDKRELEATGAVDAATWTSLTSRTRKPTDDEMHNRLTPGPALMAPGASGDRVRDLQARLKQIAWFSGSVTGTYGSATASAVKGFQAKREIPVTGEVDQRTWDRLTAMTRTPSSDELHNRTPKPSAAGLDSRCLTGRAMCISKSTNTLVWVVDGKPQMRFDVRFGSAELPTREGAFSVGWKSRDHVSTIYHTKMPYAMFFSGGQAVHYSPDFAANGYNGASHGCVNVRNLAGIQSLFAQARVGDKVIVHR
ncbi:peptidoglycan-binding protein [Microlunatus capsulatus]|uniref:Peptidoglycan hydrolase-like protein with peptidoglycan-binding domain n=1 Tax=Microlunatus capsulatus TaxID=99117 RepID=A0ABS4Z895_9ACTN|nr:peptidoglycan-binding protein [Microlunatus capsulatus]MBP2417231.1 peptidoglycan hydrolase-like protein with peptidoglycan-binding domain [Microlunatus capsulatus]